MSEFLWRVVSEKEKQEISKQAKEIMDNFSKKLEKVKSHVEQSFVERKEFERTEGNKIPQEIDRKIMFENAPEKNKDFIIAEKKTW